MGSGAILDVQRGMKPVTCMVDPEFPANRPSRRPQAAGNFPTAAEKFPRHVLVVDDEPLIRWSVAESLSDLGWTSSRPPTRRRRSGRSPTRRCPSTSWCSTCGCPTWTICRCSARCARCCPARRLILMTAFGTPEIVAEAQRARRRRPQQAIRARRAEAPRRRARQRTCRLMPNATVLVVDDEPLIRWSLVNRLKEEGYRTRRSRHRRVTPSRSIATAPTWCCSTSRCPTPTAWRC